MKFENDFDVEAPIDEVWAAILDVERVAPCVPGAQVLEQTSENAPQRIAQFLSSVPPASSV